MSNATSSSTVLAKAKGAALGKCEFCEKSGLAILPARVAIMPPESGAPRLPDVLQPVDVNGGKKLSLEGSETAYTARTLRRGYLYVYDERGAWEKYWITERGYLMRVPVGVPMNGAYAAGREPCGQKGHKEIAACITVKDPKNATRIWIGFSDAEWTPRVLTFHQDEAYRKRHMRVFDVKQWLARHNGRHAQPLDQVASIVAEYAPKTRVETFAFSPYPFHSRASTRDGLLHAAATLGPKPAALVLLDDPVGVASELAVRAREVHQGFMSRDERSRKLAVSTAILSLQRAITDRGEGNEIAAGDELEQDGHYASDGLGRMVYVANPPALPETTAVDLQQAGERAWNKYLNDYDENARKRWQSEYDREYAQFRDQTLLPLARSHVKWMASDLMSNYFHCTHDDASADDGLIYTRNLTACTQGMEQFEPCSAQYINWLNGSVADDRNVILRAILLNLKRNREKLRKELKPEVQWLAVGWDNLISAFNNSVDKVFDPKQVPEVLSQFLASVGGSLTRVLQTAVDGPVRHALVACGVVCGRPVVPVELTGRYKAFRASLIRQLLETSGVKKMSRNAMQREVSLALRRLQIRGEPMNTPVTSKFLVMIDEETIKGMPKGLKKSEQAKWLAGAVHSADEIEKLNLSAWRERINVPKAVASVGKSIPLLGNMVAGLLQWAAYQKVSMDLAGSMQHERLENQFRLGSAVLAMGATVADSIARAAGALAETTLVRGRGLPLIVIRNFFASAAIRVSILAAGVNAYWDGKNAIEAAQQKKFTLSGTLFVSSAAGIGLAFLIASVSVLWVIVTTLGYVGVGVILTFLQDDKANKWLKRCYWGVLEAKDRYQTSESEMSDLRIATGG